MGLKACAAELVDWRLARIFFLVVIAIVAVVVVVVAVVVAVLEAIVADSSSGKR